ncbi:MAG: serine/threonine-protein kinase [Vicinamibacterales bacterium]
MRLAPGSQLGPYELLVLIGAGGAGDVWTARDNRTSGIVAIKQLQSAHMARFRLDAKAISELRHPNICSLLELGPDYLVMEYIEGSTLRGPIAPDKATRLALQIASAIETAHEQGIVHGDLRPGNVIVTRGSAKLLDFGVARSRSNDHAPATIGAPNVGLAYLSPEQAQGGTPDVRSDIFSFGALLYEMLSGHRAFTGGSSAAVLKAILADEPGAFAMPESLARVVWRCLRKNPGERFQRMADARTALEQALA